MINLFDYGNILKFSYEKGWYILVCVGHFYVTVKDLTFINIKLIKFLTKMTEVEREMTINNKKIIGSYQLSKGFQ